MRHETVSDKAYNKENYFSSRRFLFFIVNEKPLFCERLRSAYSLIIPLYAIAQVRLAPNYLCRVVFLTPLPLAPIGGDSLVTFANMKASRWLGAINQISYSLLI